MSAPTSAEADFTARLDLTRPPAGPAHRLRGALRGPGRRFSACRCAVRSGRRRGRRRRCGSARATRPGRAGASTRPGRHAHLRGRCARRAGPLHPLGRPDLRRRADPPRVRSTTARSGATSSTTGVKATVAETLDEFRGSFRYNLRDANLRRFNAEVPMVAQWDDHEVRNNWYPGQVLGDERVRAYTESVSLLAARASRRSSTTRRSAAPVDPRAHLPRRPPRAAGSTCSCSTAAATAGRTPPTCSPRPRRRPRSWRRRSGPGSRRRWSRSRATWKVIACDMPIGVVVPDGPRAGHRGVANADPRAARARARSRGLLSRSKRTPHPQRPVRHGRRALRRRAPLRPGARDLHRLRSVLGVRGRAAPRRHLRPGRARRDVRPGHQVLVGAGME